MNKEKHLLKNVKIFSKFIAQLYLHIRLGNSFQYNEKKESQKKKERIDRDSNSQPCALKAKAVTTAILCNQKYLPVSLIHTKVLPV